MQHQEKRGPVTKWGASAHLLAQAPFPRFCSKPNLQLEIRNVLRVVSDPPSRIILGSCDLLSHFPLRRLLDQPGATPAVFLSLPPPLPKPFHFQHSSSTNHRHRHFISTHNQTSSQLFHPSQWLELSKPQERYYPHHHRFRILLLTSSQPTGG